QSMMSGFLKTTEDGESVYSMGLSYKKDGTLTLNGTAFKNALEKDSSAVFELFGGEEGLLTNVDSFLQGYTKSAGFLDKRKDSLQSNVSYLQDKLDRQTTALTNYETNLRKRYGAIDSLIAGLNTNLSYLDAATAGINANSK
ncbi:MAG: flagellar filament capping protein FliD, partial [Succinivibrio sp.]|nr:flagellar filament capping protein FliD [Succinivibrio sp.]